MIKAKIHEREKERLALLQSYSILDTLPEKDYDNLTKLAAEICQTPISLITLLDDKRQWFKSHYGLEVSETPIEDAFCAHAITGNDPIFITKDAREDNRFHKNPLVTGEPNIVFYAGIPLKNANGLPLGTLCVIDDKPRTLTESQKESLNVLSEQVINLLELRKNKLELERAHKKLKKFSKKLERKVFQRTNQLEIKTIKLELINNDLESFNHICSHDLQEPLRKIQMFISQVSDTEFDNLSEEGKHKLERIDLSAARMRNLIQDLLAYGSTETIDNSLTTVSLKKLVDEVKDVLSEELKEHKTVLRVQKDCEITVRPIQFKQLLFNLFTNAIKFSKREDKPVIKVSGKIVEGSDYPELQLAEEKRYSRILVSDNGIGFDQKYERKVFEIFQRLHSDEEYQGTGIGLAIVKRIITTHNGQIRVESSLGNGATFEIFIPLADQAI
ncbi:GAF domain-containing sensor histidine kinase [Maribacter stanieri]|uniref:GAF domain-containing sensor histidine kinase n=1 Tax=Maribacter stanieri TaxID=440514 RepID=UPI0024954AD6|nr:ATP-binding protein [Maribacter stanieri]|tara:strand:- start:20 stop:1351 length:1332 start_codon:yes stop_codon:yes gene_type:complete